MPRFRRPPLGSEKLPCDHSNPPYGYVCSNGERYRDTSRTSDCVPNNLLGIGFETRHFGRLVRTIPQSIRRPRVASQNRSHERVR